jgi:predicted deacetylase
MSRNGRGKIAVALHDVEPATYERCALIRDWLDDHGIDRVTLLVIPAADLHPFFQRRPALADWLLERVAGGDAIAQHGFRHQRLRRAGGPNPLRQAVASWQGGAAAEFPGLDAEETHTRVAAGRRLLELAGLEPRGFVAPGYAYTPALRRELATGFDWWATLMRVWTGRGVRHDALAVGVGGSTPMKRVLSPTMARAAALAAGPVLRLDLHPADFDMPRHVLALEHLLRRARGRRAITYDDLC